LGFTLSIGTMLSLGIFIFFLFIYSKPLSFYKYFKGQLKQPLKFSIVLIAIIGSITFYNNHKYELDLVYNVLTNRGMSIVNTIINGKYEHGAKLQTDMSAGSRVENLKFVYDNLIEDLESMDVLKLVFGHGFSFNYIDSPLIQTFQDLGIIGFIIFLMWHVYSFRLLRKYMRYNLSPVLFFVCGLYFMVVVTNLIQGTPYGYQNWIYMIFITRYLKDYKVYIPKELNDDAII
jgi:hypothetical protein